MELATPRSRAAQTSQRFWFLRADFVLSFSGKKMPIFQELQRDSPGALEQIEISFEDVLSGTLATSYCVCSHRWMLSDRPDEDGTQLRAVKEHLGANRHLKHVWFDAWCMPQGKRSPEDEAGFRAMLANVNLLYLGMSVLILLDLSYLSRFWTQLEAWLAMQDTTLGGLKSAVGTARERHTIKCIYNAGGGMAGELVRMWASKTPAEAFQTLSQPDVSVTNQSDKEVHLPKIEGLDEQVKGAFGVLRGRAPVSYTHLTLPTICSV